MLLKIGNFLVITHLYFRVGGIDGITYRIGGDGNNDKELRVKVSMNETVTPIYNVIAKIEG